jgi:hypothetical protein
MVASSIKVSCSVIIILVDIDENVQTWQKANLQPAGQGQPADNQGLSQGRAASMMFQNNFNQSSPQQRYTSSNVNPSSSTPIQCTYLMIFITYRINGTSWRTPGKLPEAQQARLAEPPRRHDHGGPARQTSVTQCIPCVN